MLKLIDVKKPTTLKEAFYASFSDGSIARCEETKAKLLKSRAQYTLVYGDAEIFITRHWSRRKVTSDADAVEKANKSLAKILQSSKSK